MKYIIYISQNYSKEIQKNYRKLGQEIDIYLPDLKLGIEFNGLYWHSEKQKNKSYHYDKLIFLKNKNINLITIWEDDWVFKQEIIISILNNAMHNITTKIDARKCKILFVNNVEKIQFLNNNHIQGNCSSSINIGLYYNSELCALITFGKMRFIMGQKNNKDNEYELLRFCSKKNCVVRGGASKLFKIFIDKYNPNKIISYSNLDIGNGDLYKTLGFKNLGYTKINYWWTDYSKRFHRSGFMKHKLVKEGFDKNKTEDEIMHERGFAKIYGNGNIKWEWNKIDI